MGGARRSAAGSRSGEPPTAVSPTPTAARAREELVEHLASVHAQRVAQVFLGHARRELADRRRAQAATHGSTTLLRRLHPQDRVLQGSAAVQRRSRHAAERAPTWEDRSSPCGHTLGVGGGSESPCFASCQGVAAPCSPGSAAGANRWGKSRAKRNRRPRRAVQPAAPPVVGGGLGWEVRGGARGGGKAGKRVPGNRGGYRGESREKSSSSTRRPSARSALCRCSSVTHGASPRMAAAVSSLNPRSTYMSCA